MFVEECFKKKILKLFDYFNYFADSKLILKQINKTEVFSMY